MDLVLLDLLVANYSPFLAYALFLAVELARLVELAGLVVHWDLFAMDLVLVALLVAKYAPFLADVLFPAVGLAYDVLLGLPLILADGLLALAVGLVALARGLVLVASAPVEVVVQVVEKCSVRWPLVSAIPQELSAGYFQVPMTAIFPTHLAPYRDQSFVNCLKLNLPIRLVA